MIEEGLSHLTSTRVLNTDKKNMPHIFHQLIGEIKITELNPYPSIQRKPL
jgi:hypothetical protein